jgi:hypothetical protein
MVGNTGLGQNRVATLVAAVHVNTCLLSPRGDWQTPMAQSSVRAVFRMFCMATFVWHESATGTTRFTRVLVSYMYHTNTITLACALRYDTSTMLDEGGEPLKRVGSNGEAPLRPRLPIALCIEGTLASAIDHRRTVVPWKKGPRQPIPHPGPLVPRPWPHAAAARSPGSRGCTPPRGGTLTG